MYLLRELATARTVPWANGGGVTTELVSFEASSELSPDCAQAWRLSIARLDAPGPFSPLPGIARTFMPLDGSLTLVVDGDVHELEPGKPLQFSGDADAVLEWLPRPCRALNLMGRGPRPGRIVAASETGRMPEGAVAALAVLRGDDECGEATRAVDAEEHPRAEDVLVLTPGITALTPQPHRSIPDAAVRFFVIPS
ncbi:HutD family protein [Leucobacter sp. CSA1]|uniref:HutD family protein n=1 Tax=Leucobacter chromiisoli TaxID=2796471 RepID=A0A934UTM9_9MICO|nr:HutD family protein [Leucobacter chromiisoli]MBK0417890.1 HutD family protein [Leucobacter chromiisoli]